MNAAELEVRGLFVLCLFMALMALWATGANTGIAIIFWGISLSFGASAFWAIFADIRRNERMAEIRPPNAE
jgi:hypothetical protein